MAAVSEHGPRAGNTGWRSRGGRVLRPFRYPARWASLLAAIAAVVLVFPGLSLSYLAWFALVPALLLFARAGTAREAVARGWWFGAGYLISMLSWMAPQIGPGLLVTGAVFGGLWAPFAAFARLLLPPGPRAWSRLGLSMALLPAAWLIPEWARSYQGLGGPWDLYGASQWQHPAVLSLAAVGGVWLVSVALVIANVAITAALGALVPGLLGPGERPAPRASGRRASGRRALLAAAGLAALVAAAGSGPLAFALTAPFPPARSVTIAMIQPGIINDDALRTHASQALSATISQPGSLGAGKPDLIVWGESSIAEDLTLPSSAPLLRQIEALSVHSGSEILVSQDATPPGKGHEKWAVLVAPAGIKGIYAKTRLVPFGEYIPFRQQLGWLTKVSKAAGSNMTPGDGARVLAVTDRAGRPLPVGVLVCFESAFPDMSRVDAGAGAQLLVYQSSTPTFQGTWGPDQHASLAAIRAAETGRPAVQAALTGDTVAFDARGRELAWMGQGAHGVVAVRLALPAGSARTFYDLAGDYVMWAGVALTAIALLVIAGRRRSFLGNTTGAADGHGAQYDADTGQPVAGLASCARHDTAPPDEAAGEGDPRLGGTVSVYGVLQVHSAPPALCPHIEWAVAGTVGVPVSMPWVSQTAAPGTLRAELTWHGKPGTAGAITSALAGWNRLRFEVTEEASEGCDAVRYCYTPGLGTFCAVTSANGDILIPEGRLRAAMSLGATGAATLEKELDKLLGTAWDHELDPFRRAGDGAPVRWLNATG
jgi:apolipoprotein N-acyltransferase